MSKIKILTIGFISIIIIISIFLLISRIIKNSGDVNLIESNSLSKYKDKKVLIVNSYHEGFEWGDGEQEGIEKTLTEAGVEFDSLYMDTKNNPSADFGESAGILARDKVIEYNPDVVIVADDAALKYFVAPFYKNSSLPVVFCGVNWSLDSYGGRYTNITGILEVALYKEMVTKLNDYSKGSRVGFLTGDNISEYKNAEFFKETVDSEAEIVFVKDFSEWKKEFVEIQNKVDILVVGISAGIVGWDDEEAREFALVNTKIPTGVEQSWMTPFALLGYTKNPQEQGEVAAKMALEILGGKVPGEIEIVKNKKGDLFVNLAMAEKLSIVLNADIIKNAKIVE